MKAPSQNSTDKELIFHVRKFPEAETKVFELLYVRHYPAGLKVSRRCLTLFRIDSDQSRDIVQDVFIRLPRIIRSVRDPTRFKGYLSSIVYRATLAYCRKHCRCDSVDPTELDRLAMPCYAIDRSMRDELLEVLSELLTEKEFRIIEMRVREGLSNSEISEMESISEPTVRWYIGCARKTVRELLFSRR